MKRTLSYLSVFLLLLLTSCYPSFRSNGEPRIVVEGWIENGGFPVVILTSTIPVDDEFHDWQSVQDHIIRWARVSIYDGEQEYVLTGKVNKDYFPPYIYTTSKLRGEVGKTYSLKVKYDGKEVTSYTTIPEPAYFKRIEVERSSNGKASIKAFLEDQSPTEDYYKIFVMTQKKDSVYKSSFMGLFSDEILSEGENEIIVRGGENDGFGKSESSIYHECDDVVYVKLCTMEYEPFCYWQDHEEISLLSNNPLFPVNHPIRSNVSSGYGYWAGYGMAEYKVSVADALKR